MIHLVQEVQCQLDALSEPLLSVLGNNFLFMLILSPRSKLAKENAFCRSLRKPKVNKFSCFWSETDSNSRCFRCEDKEVKPSHNPVVLLVPNHKGGSSSGNCKDTTAPAAIRFRECPDVPWYCNNLTNQITPRFAASL